METKRKCERQDTALRKTTGRTDRRRAAVPDAGEAVGADPLALGVVPREGALADKVDKHDLAVGRSAALILDSDGPLGKLAMRARRRRREAVDAVPRTPGAFGRGLERIRLAALGVELGRVRGRNVAVEGGAEHDLVVREAGLVPRLDRILCVGERLERVVTAVREGRVRPGSVDRRGWKQGNGQAVSVSERHEREAACGRTHCPRRRSS